MKKIILTLLSIILVLSFVGCSGENTSDALKSYIEDNLIGFLTRENEINNELAYYTANGSFKVSSKHIIDLSLELSNDCMLLTSKLENSEIITLHGKFSLYTQSLWQACTSLGQLLDGTISYANFQQIAQDAENKAEDFKTALVNLAKEHDVDLSAYDSKLSFLVD